MRQILKMSWTVLVGPVFAMIISSCAPSNGVSFASGEVVDEMSVMTPDELGHLKLYLRKFDPSSAPNVREAGGYFVNDSDLEIASVELKLTLIDEQHQPTYTKTITIDRFNDSMKYEGSLLPHWKGSGTAKVEVDPAVNGQFNGYWLQVLSAKAYRNPKDLRVPSHFFSLIINDRLKQVKTALDQDPSLATMQDVRSADQGIHFAAFSGDSELISLFLERGARLDAKNNDSLLPVHFAARGTVQGLQFMLDHAQPLDAPDRVNWTPLEYAVSENNVKTVDFLLDHGADIDHFDSNGFCPLSHTFSLRHDDMLVHLLKRGANPNAVDKQTHLTPFGLAVHWQTDLLDIFFDHGAAVNVHDERGWTALHEAAKFGLSSAALYLLKHGADPTIKSSNGNTAAMIARNYHNDQVAKMIESFKQ